MTTNDPFEQHRAAFGAELRRATPKTRSRRRRALALGGASMALAGAATAVLVIAPSTGSRLDVLSEAQAAITTTPNTIIHYALRFESGYPRRKVDVERGRGCETEPGEVWRATTPGPPRYRIRIPLNPCAVTTIGDRIATGSFDIAYADRTQKLYAAADGFMQVTPNLPAEADEAGIQMLLPTVDPRLTDDDSADPVARIRAMLAEGALTDAGELQGDDGRTLRRLVGTYSELRGDPKRPTPREVKVDYRVDAETFAPVQLSTTRSSLVPKDVNAPIRRSPMVRRDLTDTLTFSIYETVPVTEETERLLTVQPAAGTDVSTQDGRSPGRARPSAAERARAQRIVDQQIKAGTRLRAEW